MWIETSKYTDALSKSSEKLSTDDIVLLNRLAHHLKDGTAKILIQTEPNLVSELENLEARR